MNAGTSVKFNKMSQLRSTLGKELATHSLEPQATYKAAIIDDADLPRDSNSIVTLNHMI